MPIVRDVMTPRPSAIVHSASVQAAVELLAELDVRHLPVLGDDGTLVGVLSDRDLRGQEFRSETPVAVIMNPNVVAVAPDDDLTEAIDTMLEEHVGALPVVDPERRLVGILSYVDMLRAYQRELGEAAATP